MSIEHCLTCFETLVAHHEKRTALTLDQIRSSYANYLSSTSKPQDPTLLRVADTAKENSNPSSSASSSSLDLSPSTAATSASASSTDLKSAPLFVTWNTIDDENDPDDVSLRGCIGTFEPQPLTAGLPEYALISALQDHRFSPIPPSLLPRLQACVTLLTDFEPVADPYDWVVGTHGIRLSFTDKGRRYSGTYLPDVASEQGWTKEEALYSLVRKAGWGGGKGRFEGLELGVVRYQGMKASSGYKEYKAWRDWHDGR